MGSVSQPLLLLLCGNCLHYNIATIYFPIVVCFHYTPRMSHKISWQLCVGPLKWNWGDVCYKFIQQHPSQMVTKFQFSNLFSKAWMKSMVPWNIVTGLKKWLFLATVMKFCQKCNWIKTIQKGNVYLISHQRKTAIFQHTSSERYNLYDPCCLAWLKLSVKFFQLSMLLQMYLSLTLMT